MVVVTRLSKAIPHSNNMVDTIKDLLYVPIHSLLLHPIQSRSAVIKKTIGLSVNNLIGQGQREVLNIVLIHLNLTDAIPARSTPASNSEREERSRLLGRMVCLSLNTSNTPPSTIPSISLHIRTPNVSRRPSQTNFPLQQPSSLSLRAPRP